MKVETFVSKTGNSGSICFVTLVLMVCGSSAFALDPMGPPIAGLRQGQLKEAVEYSYSTMDLELNAGKWIERLDGVFFDSGKADSLTLKKFKTNKVYFNLGYGITDNMNAFLRLGAAVGRFGDSIWEDAEKFDSNTEFAIGCGIKATFYEKDNLKLGGLFQATWSEFDGRLKAPHWSAADFTEINITEIQVAAGPTYRLAEGVSIYGGPFFHFISGGLDDQFSQASGGGLLTSRYSWDLEERSTFGGYVGAQLELDENSSINIEYQHTADADALSVGLIWRF